EGDPSFGEILERVREVSLGAYGHQDLPFERLVEELSPVRSLAHSPLFQVMVALQNAPVGRLALPGLELVPVELASGMAKFDLTLTLDEEGLTGALEYARDLFDATTMVRFMERLERLLAGAAADPTQRLLALPLLSEVEGQQLVEWNGKGSVSPRGGDLRERLAAQAGRTPEAVALRFEGAALTYAELDARAGRLARHLCSLGVGPEALVGICAERSLDLVVGILAVVKAGGAYVPLDPDHPRDRLAFILEDAAIGVLLVQGRLAGRLPAHGRPTVLLDAARPEGAAQSASLPMVPVPAESLIYVIYTSGSTGRPKGVGATHAGFANLLDWYAGDFGFAAAERVLILSSFGFDMTQKNFFVPLLVGGEVHLAAPQYDPAALVATIERERIARLNCTPSAFYPLLEQGEPERLAALRSVFLGGEPIASARLASWQSSPSCRAEVVNIYGPTECTDIVGCHRLAGPDHASVPLGRPIPGARLTVFSPALEPVPTGVAGQLCIGGICPGRGYLGDPAMTAARFVPDPLTGIPGQRLYLSGDRASQRPNGTLEYLGRIDHQVKVRGFRVELGEIEAVLGEHPGVREAVVVVRTDVPGEQRLAAYVVSREGAGLPAAELARYLAVALPAYMVPASFVLLPALPLNSNGKVDRRALPAPGELATDARETFVPPRDPIEELLCEIWADVLGLPRVGVHDDFFGLGGHSLLAPRIVLRLRQAFGVEVPVRALFRQPTVAGLA
ncbi:MAG TPA: amino acid adenylation domain-containing protein, partial [Thermoanaerobaculia bacterium]|nr:amino acid adenylation domain-containing protein [Thermoanaerobaculia bacterium]